MKSWFFLGLTLFTASCTKETPLFEKTDATKTGVTFVNQLNETEQENVLAFEYFYNGGGVATGDLNNDGLTDVFFTGNQVENKLYVNIGNLTFDDVSAKAGIGGRASGWKTGVTLADVNADGWLDIYVCYSGLRSAEQRKNQLFINNHNLTFTDRATEYGLADTGYSIQATFFDYDLDGDLDCFLINHNVRDYQRKEAAVMRAERDPNAGDKLFRNEGNGYFVDVSEQAGIKGNPLGFGLGASVSDIDRDGYPDIYVTNDYVEDDYLYINQKDGTFRDQLRERIEHTPYSAMGVDVADVNNDALPDIFALDMLPESNARQKTLPWPDNWNVYQAQLQNGFWHQNMRNTLQIQQPNGQFAEVGQLAGVAATDWSWGALLADFDLDGYKDVFVSNGILRDFTNADFIKYSDNQTIRKQSSLVLEQIKQMPSTRTKNYIFRNNGANTSGSPMFTNKQEEWGINEATVSNGCAYADLDNDGDLEIITNNLNETARIYKNQSQETNPQNYVKVKFKGPQGNPFGVGATVTVEQDSLKQTQEWYPTRGFESCSHGDMLVGLGKANEPTSVSVRWPDGKVQHLNNVALNQTLTLNYRNASTFKMPQPLRPQSLFVEVTGVDYTHRIEPINNFDRQILLPMQYSATGPHMAVGDVNGDGSEDAFVCGNVVQPGTFFLQKQPGSFTAQPLTTSAQLKNNDAVLADFNGDKRLDLYVANGGYEVREYLNLQDQLWLNESSAGTVRFSEKNLPREIENGSCVEVLDVDRDGDLDLFVGGSIKPNRFPVADESFILINDGKANFTKQSVGKLGLVSDVTVLDFDKDGWQDLVVVGEWMPVTVLLNQKGRFSAESQKVFDNLAGWWNRVEKADLDADGDEDLIVGNLGLNSPIRASEQQPATLVYDDFDANGTLDFFMNYAVQGKLYPAYSRDELCEQVSSLRKRFTSYDAYANATLGECFDPQALKQAKEKQINELRTVVLENDNGNFITHPLPLSAQYAPVYGILTGDFDKNGTVDLLLTGNNSQMRLRIGKVDANHGVVLRNRDNWRFEDVQSTDSGLFVRGDVRDVKRVGDYVWIGVNNQKLLTFKLGSTGGKRNIASK